MRLNSAIVCGLIALTALAVGVSEPGFAQTDTLAPGVLKVIPAKPLARDTYTLPMVLPGVNANEWDPNYASKKHTLYGQTRSIVMYRDVWQYELGMLGLRQMRVNVTQTDGSKSSRNVWYMVYRIRNLGNGLTYKERPEAPGSREMIRELVTDPKVQPEKGDFLPRFTLEGWAVDNGEYKRVSVRDNISPSLLRLIQNREDPALMLVDTFGMNAADIPLASTPVDEGVWGVAIWEGVDPRLDYVSVKVNGITNAYRVVNKPDGSLAIKRRTLQLNFWRPGDTVDQDRDFVKFGIPLVDSHQEQIEICRKYRLPGPVIKGYFVNPAAEQEVLVAEADAQLDLETLKSPIVPQLDQGQLPEAIATQFATAGYDVPAGTAVSSVIPGKKWSFNVDGREFTLMLEPQFWEPKPNGGIRFIKSLDYLWIYR